MSLHELGHDLVFARKLGFELLDGLVLGILDSFGVAAIFEEGVAVLEKLFLPTVEERRRDLELVADGRDGDAFEQMPLEGGDLLLGRENDETSVQVRLTRTERFSRFD